MIREPAVAGRFYAGRREACLAEIEGCLARARAQGGDLGQIEPGRRVIVGGVVPHAGWICSGAIAARVFDEIQKGVTPTTVVVFGAIHVRHGPRASVFPSGAWRTPLGLAGVEDRLVERICGQTGLVEPDAYAHEGEHSIEVEVPFIQRLLPEATIVPIMVPPGPEAAALGGAVGQTCKGYGVRAVFLASTDLTHYGPSYGFMPRGVGIEGIEWASKVNDRRMIELIEAMREETVVAEAQRNHNACGSGAIAATIAACKACGATRGRLLAQTSSYEVLREHGETEALDSVGYAGMLFT